MAGFSLDKCKIRDSVIEDAYRVAQVRVRSWQSNYSKILDPKFLEGMSIESSFQKRLSIIKSAIHSNLVAEYEGVVIGFSDAGESRNPKNKKEAEIYALYIDDDFKGNGVGSKLLEQQMRILKSQGYESLVIWVLKENQPACSFYKSKGGVSSQSKMKMIGNKECEEISYYWKLNE